MMHLEAASPAEPVPGVKRGAQRSTVVPGSGLNVHVGEGRLGADLSVGNAVHRAASGKAEPRVLHTCVKRAQDGERRLFVDALQRSGDRFVARLERLLWPARGAQKRFELWREHLPDSWLA